MLLKDHANAHRTKDCMEGQQNELRISKTNESEREIVHSGTTLPFRIHLPNRYRQVYKRCIYTAIRRYKVYIEFSDSKFTLELAANATCQTIHTKRTQTLSRKTRTHSHPCTMHINCETFTQVNVLTHVCARAMRRLYFAASQTSY